ncbi:MAG: hypothetical protein OEO23_13715, partial [Gemmatimonadota bacterium]|nr:hypothetical protein [Gemmatimonadota bacterium]
MAVLQGCAGPHGSAGQTSQSTRHETPVRQEPPPIPPGLPAAPGEYDLAAEVLHYDLELALGSSDIVARARVTVAGGGSREIPFDFTGLLVRSVALEGRPVDFVHDGGKLLVPLGATQDTVTVEIRYAGTPDDGLIIRTNSRGRPSAFVDNWPNRTRFWLPSIDHPADKATAAFTVHAPAEWEVVANGRMVADPEPTREGSSGGRPGMRTWRWETRVPQPSYTLVVGATDFHIESVGRAACGLSPATPDPDGCIDVTIWAYDEDVPFARRVFGRADQMVDYFAGRFGPYPFEKLAHV